MKFGRAAVGVTGALLLSGVSMSAQTPAGRRGAAVPAATSLEEADAALASVRQALHDAPTPDNYRRVGDAYARRGVLDAAFDHYAAGLRLAPTDGALLDGMARVWRDWGFADRALGSAYRAVYYAPDLAAARNTLGTILLAVGWDDAADRAFEHARELDPGAAYIENNRCVAALRRGDAPGAIDRCRAAVAIEPRLNTAHENLAQAYVATGDFENAGREFALAATPARAHYNLGLAYVRAGRLDAAATAFQAAWEADHTFLLAGERLRQVNVLRAGAPR